MAFRLVPEQYPSLHKIAKRLDPHEIGRDYVQHFIADMWTTMRDPRHPGIGLAAPQLGQEVRIITIEDTTEHQKHLTAEQLAARGRVPIPAQVLINPEYDIIDASIICFFEGCLSYQGRLRAVLRHRSIRVRAIDHNGASVAFDASDWFARLLQHEIDHLNGITLNDTDRVIGGPWVTIPEFQAKGYVDFSSDQLRTAFNI